MRHRGGEAESRRRRLQNPPFQQATSNLNCSDLEYPLGWNRDCSPQTGETSSSKNSCQT